MDFCQLQSRLLAGLRDRVRGGETTERRLARISGISQPHLHNILKGVRELTPGMADRLLRTLELSVIDLIEPSEVAHLLEARPRVVAAGRELPVLMRRLGPGSAWPIEESRFERVSVPAELLEGMGHTVVVRLASDC